MGVKGLTSYIASRADHYLVPFELHDTCLVIDGDSLASNLYQWHPHTNGAFGGDYNQYHHIVHRFFAALHKCRVRAFVLLDGGYQRRKLKTVHSRLRSKICSIRHLNPSGGNHLFPLHMRECFVDAVRQAPGAPQLMRCLFEADDEVAQLARQLNCPVLSYDSDFYIHSVPYIPSVTLTRRPLRRAAPRRNRRKPAATNAQAQAAFREYWYMDCCVYTMAQLTRGQIGRDVWPLFGVLLGNDYVSRRVFAKFFASGVSRRHVGRRHSPQQKRIVGLLRWLRGETLETAVKKVLGSVEAASRGKLAWEIEQAMEGYVKASGEWFGLAEKDVREGEWDVEVVAEEEDASDADEQAEDDDEDADATNSASEEANSASDSDNSDETTPDTNPHSPAAFQHRHTIEHLNNAPAWALQLIRSAAVPRYVVDLLALRLYINAPQVENVQLPESNHIARPILALVYALLYHPLAPPAPFNYLTRDSKNPSTFVEQQIDAADLHALPPFTPEVGTLNAGLFVEALFAEHPLGADGVRRIVEQLPAAERLFAMSMAYAAAATKLLRREHLHAQLVCMFALRRCAERGCAYMDEEHFGAQFGKYVAAHDANGSASASSVDQHEAIMLSRNLCAHLQPSKMVRSRHTAFSATTVHAFAEWQAVTFHLNTLAMVLGEPYEKMRMAQVFNGTLAYNLTVLLADRPDMMYYIRQHLFRGCAALADEYAALVKALAPLVERLEDGSEVPAGGAGDGAERKKKTTRNQRKLAKKRAAKGQEGAVDETAESGAQNDANREDDGAIDGYDGIGNRFANLLL